MRPLRFDLFLCAIALSHLTACEQRQEAPKSGTLRVCVSSTDVRSLVQAVAGDTVEIAGLVRADEDPHVVNATPEMVEALARADLLFTVGNGLEEAWLPPLLESANNPHLASDGGGHIELAQVMRTIGGPAKHGPSGCFHPEDNPHFLIDPVEGVKAARLIADTLSEKHPDKRNVFDRRFREFSRTVMTAMLGESLAGKFNADQFEGLAIAIENDSLAAHLESHGAATVALGGYLGRFRKFRDTPVVGDHDAWPYLARRYGLRILSYLEPEPGVPPTAKQHEHVIEEMKAEQSRVILTVPYFDSRHADFVTERTGAVVVPMANNPGSRPGTETYLTFVGYNADQLLMALEKPSS